MADVNDRIQLATVEPDRSLERYDESLVRIPFEWNVAQPYTIGLTVEDGTRFEKKIEAAAPALEPSLELVGFFAIIGCLCLLLLYYLSLDCIILVKN